jgi:hypothetical protein
VRSLKAAVPMKRTSIDLITNNPGEQLWTKRQILTQEQLSDPAGDLCQAHDLTADQVSFEGDRPESDIRLRSDIACSVSTLTDIQHIDCWVTDRDVENKRATVKCTITLPDGRTRAVESSAEVGEAASRREGDQYDFDSPSMLRDRVRPRLGIRSVGVNLFKAHKKFKETGEVAAGHTRFDPRKPIYDEIHALAASAALIVDGDKSAYRHFLSETFEGVVSAKDLNDSDLRKLQVMLRAMVNANRYQEKKAA